MAHKGRDRYLKISKDSVFYNALVLSSSGVALQILGFVYRIYLSRLAGAEGLGAVSYTHLGTMNCQAPCECNCAQTAGYTVGCNDGAFSCGCKCGCKCGCGW